jgi:hypothetical protein
VADGIMGGTQSVANVVIMTAVIVGWSYLFDLLGYHLPFVHRFLRDVRWFSMAASCGRTGGARRSPRKNRWPHCVRRASKIWPRHARPRLDADGQISAVKSDRSQV